MRYVQINSRGDRWADSIIFSKHRELIASGDESWVFWARGEHEQDNHMVKFSNSTEIYTDVALTRLDGKAGFHSKTATKRLLKKLDRIDPDVVHLHVLSNYYINVELLFEWLAVHRCKVVWTQHDCWAFTGHCIYFTASGCNQWKRGCAEEAPCPQLKGYPETYANNESVNWCFDRKKRLFTMLAPDRMELITPSQWLADLVGQSFLSKYPVRVVHNTINTDIFKPTPSDFRERYGIGDRFMVLGVASKWSDRKGLDDFVRLASELDERFAIMLVGLSKKQIKEMPERIVALPRTESARELAEAYTAADLLFNPTQEDNYPTVNLEAEACGCDVVTYDIGGCRETVKRARSRVVEGYEGALKVLVSNASLRRSFQ